MILPLHNTTTTAVEAVVVVFISQYISQYNTPGALDPSFSVSYSKIEFESLISGKMQPAR